MASIKNLKAARKFGPGYFIREQMEMRGWVQEELADILGISTKHLSSILQDKQSLSIENAKKLSSAFNTSPQYWLNLDNDYRLWLEHEKREQTATVESKAIIYSRMPVRDMMKKRWLQPTRDLKELTGEVKKFWGIPELDFAFLEEAVLPLCKKSEAYNQFNASYAATWFQMAKTYSLSFKTPAYNKGVLENLYKNLADYTTLANGIEMFIKELNACGVKFFVLPHLEKTYLDGAAFLLDGAPVIVYTARYKRIDNFWFTVAHEIAHVLKHLNEKTPFILDNLREQTPDKQEEEANKLAAKHLKHTEILEYLKPHFNYLTVGKIEKCSEAVNIHPAIIIGALVFNEKISFRNQTLFNENVMELIPIQFIHQSLLVA
ncbi:MAG: HigA family addiction module antitoxin [Bacteroidales bacterium]|nr:HigA family addiction module antitoxin [Bacteroidales bacterium]